MDSIVTIELIEKKIYLIRGQKVMIDSDLAELYGVPAKVLNQSVKRNLKRFPTDFMFQLNEDEYASLRSQFVTLKKGRGQHRKYPPFAFTEQGVAMLSSVLNSDKAIEMNILIMRVFIKIREMIISNKDMAKRLDELEKKYDAQFNIVFDAILKLITHPEPEKKKIGFRVKEKATKYRTSSRKNAG